MARIIIQDDNYYILFRDGISKPLSSLPQLVEHGGGWTLDCTPRHSMGESVSAGGGISYPSHGRTLDCTPSMRESVSEGGRIDDPNSTTN